jgi:MFS family permease
MPRNLQVFLSASLGFFFVTATTFTSLGYVLFTMVAELGWSQAAAGMSFSLLGLACGLSSPLPPLLMKAIGTCNTMVLGGLVLAAGFLLAGTVETIGPFFLATTLMGIGFSLVAPSPAVYLIATWFPRTAPRMIGFYFMSGALGGVVGPLIVSMIVGFSGSWRIHWLSMAGASVVLALLFLATIRDSVKVETIDQVKRAGAGDAVAANGNWTVRQAMATRSFAIVVLGMIVVQTVVTTMHSVLVTHVAGLGGGAAPGALAMSLLALTGTLAKGVSGAITERIPVKLVLVGGLALQFVATALLCLIATPGGALTFALIFGLGWGFAWLSAHVLLLRYFGAAIAGDLTAMATMATTFAVLGPISAGWTADLIGHYLPVFAVFAVLLGLVTVGTGLFLQGPAAAPASPDEEAEEAHEALLVPAE